MDLPSETPVISANRRQLVTLGTSLGIIIVALITAFSIYTYRTKDTVELKTVTPTDRVLNWVNQNLDWITNNEMQLRQAVSQIKDTDQTNSRAKTQEAKLSELYTKVAAELENTNKWNYTGGFLLATNTPATVRIIELSFKALPLVVPDFEKLLDYPALLDVYENFGSITESADDLQTYNATAWMGSEGYPSAESESEAQLSKNIVWIAEYDNNLVVFKAEYIFTDGTPAATIPTHITDLMTTYPPTTEASAEVHRRFAEERIKNDGYNFVTSKTLRSQDSSWGYGTIATKVFHTKQSAECNLMMAATSDPTEYKCLILIATPTQFYSNDITVMGGEPLKWINSDTILTRNQLPPPEAVV